MKNRPQTKPRFRAPIIVALGMACALGRAQAPDPDSALYIESVVLAKRGPLCAARMPGYAEAFEPAFAKWKSERAARLQRGETVLREELAKATLDFNLHLGAITDPPARQLGKLSQAMLETNCQAMLRRLGDS
jgi:hypothetical protein